MSPDAKTFVAKAVHARRTVLRLSQQELAEKIGMTRQAVDRIERGQMTPSLRTLELLAGAFEVPVSDLLP